MPALPWHEFDRRGSGDNPIRNAQVGSAFPTAIQNQQLMSHQRSFGNDGPESTRPCKSKCGDQHVNEKDEDVAHRGWYQPRIARIQRNLVIRHPRVEGYGHHCATSSITLEICAATSFLPVSRSSATTTDPTAPRAPTICW